MPAIAADQSHYFSSAGIARQRRPGTDKHQDHAGDDVVPDEGLDTAKTRDEERSDIPKLPKT